jgi:DNA-binding transcriptional LysR family regulator
MAIDARSLRYFAEIVSTGSVSRAAEALGISQPALSKCIRELEAQLRVKLLDRTARGVSPTLFGRTLYLRATSVTAEISRAQAEIRALAEAGTELVSVGVLPSQTHWLPEAALTLLKSRPRIRLRIIERARGDLMSGLLRSEFDLIISVIRAGHVPPHVSSQVLFHDRPSIILRKSHPLARDSKTRLRSLGQYPWIVPPVGSERWDDLDQALRLAGIAWPPKTIVECHSNAFLKSMVVQSDCVGLLPNDAPTAEEQAGLLKAIRLERVPLGRAVGLLYRNDYPQTDAAVAVIREIQAVTARLNQGAAAAKS